MKIDKPWKRDDFSVGDDYNEIDPLNYDDISLSAYQFGDDNTQINIGQNYGETIGTQNNYKVEKLIQGISLPNVAMIAFAGMALEHILHNEASQPVDVRVIHKHLPTLVNMWDSEHPIEVAYGSWHHENVDHVLYLYKYHPNEWDMVDVAHVNEMKYIPILAHIDPTSRDMPKYTLIGENGLTTTEHHVFQVSNDHSHLTIQDAAVTTALTTCSFHPLGDTDYKMIDHQNSLWNTPENQSIHFTGGEPTNHSWNVTTYHHEWIPDVGHTVGFDNHFATFHLPFDSSHNPIGFDIHQMNHNMPNDPSDHLSNHHDTGVNHSSNNHVNI